MAFDSEKENVKNQNESNANEAIIPNQLAPYWQELRETLLPLVQQATRMELTDRLQRLAQLLEVVRIEEHVARHSTGGRGRPSIDRRPLARAFLAKAALNLSDTRALIEQLKQSPCLRRLCGMTNVPSEATFSRAFSTFARLNLGDTTHKAVVEKFVGKCLVMHTSHDSTAIETREKAQVKVKPTVEKKSGVALGKAKCARIRNLPESSGKSRWRRTPPSRNFRAVVIGESNAVPTGIHIVGGDTKPIYPGRTGWSLCFV